MNAPPQCQSEGNKHDKHSKQFWIGRWCIQDSTNVLLIGFVDEDVEEINRVLSQISWDSVATSDSQQSRQLCFDTRFDLILIDVDKIEKSAPMMLTQIRGSSGRSAGTTIAVTGAMISPEQVTQLISAGADLAFNKPQDPKSYITYFTRAATLRLQSTRYL